MICRIETWWLGESGEYWSYGVQRGICGLPMYDVEGGGSLMTSCGCYI